VPSTETRHRAITEGVPADSSCRSLPDI